MRLRGAAPSLASLALAVASCATAPAKPTTSATAACATCPTPVAGQGGAPVAAHPDERCVHGVACETCVKCHPELLPRFQAAGDWCPEHSLPESQCGICHPALLAAPLAIPDGADFRRIAARGADVASLESLAAPGKVTVIDFYADWCGPCLKVDERVFALLRTERDLAYRKLDIASWETPLARHYLAKAPSLPYLIVFGRDGKVAGSVSGLALDELDRLIAIGRRP